MLPSTRWRPVARWKVCSISWDVFRGRAFAVRWFVVQVSVLFFARRALSAVFGRQDARPIGECHYISSLLAEASSWRSWGLRPAGLSSRGAEGERHSRAACWFFPTLLDLDATTLVHGRPWSVSWNQRALTRVGWGGDDEAFFCAHAASYAVDEQVLCGAQCPCVSIVLFGLFVRAFAIAGLGVAGRWERLAGVGRRRA
eukprot:scaffold47561_cov58-Phaeocystis_antarctica.AAC.3